jgi:hypothetical protein
MVYALDRVATLIGNYILLKEFISRLKYYTLKFRLITVLKTALNLGLFTWRPETAFF